jgi:hypothetical protein
MARAVGLTFMGIRVASWPEDRRASLEAFFSRVAFKGTAEWKEEIVYLDPESTAPMEGTLPDGTRVQIGRGEDPRVAFADWLTGPENPYFARAVVNRIWSWLLGRGIVHEPDDMGPDNPPSSPALLAYLEDELRKADHDLRHIYRIILNSRTYQQSSIPRTDHPDGETLFAFYPVRRLDAEVLLDALSWISGTGEGYTSAIPEPFTFIPEGERSISLADGSITSPFLEMFGRPTRDTGLESERDLRTTEAQLLHLINSTHIQRKIDRSWRMRRLMQSGRKDRGLVIRSIYVTTLSRHPTAAEMATVREYFATDGLNPRQAAIDLVWAIINSKEFLYRH